MTVVISGDKKESTIIFEKVMEVLEECYESHFFELVVDTKDRPTIALRDRYFSENSDLDRACLEEYKACAKGAYTAITDFKENLQVFLKRY